MVNSMSCCAFTNKVNGKKCNKRGRYDCDGVWLCGTHRNVQHLEEDCPICLCSLKTSRRIKLSCGHTLHIDCLSKCVRRECPLCRSRITPANCCTIYKDSVIEPLTKGVFTLSEESQHRVFTGIYHLVNLTQKSEWLGHNMCVLCERFNKTSMTLDHIETILRLLDDTMYQAESTGGLQIL